MARKNRSGKARTRDAAKRKSKPKPRGGFGSLLRLALTASIWGAVGLTALVAWYAYDLPDIARIEAAATRRPAVTLLASDGSQLARIGDLYGAPVRLADLPADLPRAVIATEDRRFYSHFGVDLIGVARALVANLRAGGIRQGGSTITQQLAKNLFLTRARTIRRKVQETLLALWLEGNLTKDEILTVYLNRVYFGAAAYGVEAAARRYFAKSATRLSLWESAALAGLLKAPSRDNPLASPKRAAGRARQVLANMVAVGWLTPAKAKAARRSRVVARRPVRPDLGSGARYFVDWALDQVKDYLGYYEGDIVVRTTLDVRLQRLAEAEMGRTLRAGAGRGVGEGALVALGPGGDVRAMVGGRDYRASQFNRATQALRQPGSAFKLFVYLAGIEAGARPDDRLLDRPITVEGWTPRNAGRRHQGEVTLREGAARSLNSVAVALAERAGRDRVVGAARRLGITSRLKPDPSLALGAHEVTLLELAGAYAAIANGGMGVWPHGISDIRETGGRVLYRRGGGGPGRVVAARHVATLNALLTAVVDWGTGKRAKLDNPPRPAAGKTGTSQNYRDAWFLGYTADLTAGVWLGNDDGKAMKRVGGGSLPAELWRDFMTEALRGAPPKALPGLVSNKSIVR